MKEKFLTPICVNEPPHHTQLKIRCLTCKKFPVCSIKDDYLKTVQLIQEVLGDPQFDRKINCYNSDKCISTGFKGYDFDYPEKIFPECILTQTGQKGIFMTANYGNTDIIQFMYNIESRHVLFKVFWNKKKQEYTLGHGKEIFYGYNYYLSTHTIEDIRYELNKWREEMEEKERYSKHLDVINTTYFSACLDCAFYEYEKGLTEEEGFKRMFADCSCDSDNHYKHLATFHVEPQKIPCYHPKIKQGFCPIPYPVYFPPKCEKKPAPPPKKRGDLNHEC